LDVRDELRRDVQENSVVYVKKHGQRPELKRIQLHWATPRIEVEVCLTQAAAWDRNLQPYGATPGTDVLGKKTPSAKTCTFSPTFANHP